MYVSFAFVTTVAPLQDFVPNIINFIHSVAEQMAPLSNLDEDEASLLKLAADLMGDLGSAFRKDLQPVLNRSMPWVNQALKQLGQQGEDHYESAEWAASVRHVTSCHVVLPCSRSSGRHEPRRSYKFGPVHPLSRQMVRRTLG